MTEKRRAHERLRGSIVNSMLISQVSSNIFSCACLEYLTNRWKLFLDLHENRQ